MKKERYIQFMDKGQADINEELKLIDLEIDKLNKSLVNFSKV